MTGTGRRGRGIFLDRDGTLIHLVPYLADPRRVRLHEGVAGALRALRATGARLVVVTNQAGIARGLLTADDARRVNERMERLLKQSGVTLDAIALCPHHPAFTGECRCRKPKPFLIREAARRFRLDLSRSWMIGDSVSDIEAGRNAGTRTALVLTGYGRRTRTELARPADVTGGTLAAVAREILAFG